MQPVTGVAPSTRLGWALVLLWLFGSALVMSRGYANALDDATDTALAEVDAVGGEIADAIVGAREDVVMLARASEQALAEGNEPAIEALFLAFAGSHHGVSQVRYLDADGHERVRVERVGNRLQVSDVLQDKSDRYYFQEAAALERGGVFVSRIDLNVEHGRVQWPARPTVRVASPIHDAGALRAVIVVNLSAEPLLGAVARHRALTPGTLMLVDHEGFYVSHPDPDHQWGAPSLLDTGYGLANDDPELLRWIWASDAKAYRRHDGAIAVRGAAGTSRELPRVVLVLSRVEAMGSQLGSLVPPIVASTSGLVIVVVLTLAWGRQHRLEAELVREIEQRRELADREERLRDAQSRLVATARLAALSASAATLAHEVRNPLGAIVNSAGLLHDEEALDEDSRALLAIVRGEAERLERAVANFVDRARPSTPAPTAIRIEEVAADVVELARHDPHFAQGLELTLDVEADLPVVRIDPDELRQVLWNLLRNAGDATRHAGGEAVQVRVLRADSSKPCVVLEVVDQGDGPPSDSPDDWPTRGTGVGLIIVAGVVARYGGRFELVARADGAGAVARVQLPFDTTGDQA